MHGIALQNLHSVMWYKYGITEFQDWPKYIISISVCYVFILFIAHSVRYHVYLMKYYATCTQKIITKTIGSAFMVLLLNIIDNENGIP